MRAWRRITILLIVSFWLSVLLSACSLSRSSVEPRWLVLLTSRELDESGLLDVLLPPYEQATGVRIKRLPLTTAKALDYAALAGVDLLLLPAGSAFDQLAGPSPTYPPFQRQPLPTPTAFPVTVEPAPQPPGHLFNERRLAFWSQLVLIAPINEPPATQWNDAATLLKSLAVFNGKFYAAKMAYEPGLKLVEQRLWSVIGRNEVASRGSGYREIDGDIQTILKKAASDQAYTLAPLDSFVASQTSTSADNTANKLKIVLSDDNALFLGYELALPNNIASQDRDVKLARTLRDYLINQAAQNIISKYTSQRFSNLPYRPYYFPVYLPPL